MLSNPGGRQKIIQLSERPSVHDLKDFMTAASQERSVKFCYCWQSADGRQVSLTVKNVSPTGFTCEWHMEDGDGVNAKQLWSLLTDNTLKVYDALIEALGEHRDAARLDGFETFSKLPSFGKNQLGPPTSPPLPPPQPRSRRPSAELGQTFDSFKFSGASIDAPKEEMLKGTLSLVHITNLLQSIGIGAMSGRLRVQRHTIWADIFFEDGHPVHAEGTRGTGEDCLLQVICWTEGDFQFEPKIKSEERTINRPLESLILEGILLLDHTTYLTSHGIRLTTLLVKVRSSLSDAEFERIADTGEEQETNNLKELYEMVDGQRTLEDLISERDLARSQWVPMVSDLIRLNLVEISTAKGPHRSAQGKAINYEMAEATKQVLVDPASGFYRFGSFLFLLQELVRCSHDMQISLLLIEVQPIGSNLRGKVPLSPGETQELAWHISEAASFKGLMAHYEDHDFALVLPGVSAEKAARRAAKLLKSIVNTGLRSGEHHTNVIVSVGIACFPDDAIDLSTLIGEAERAREKAKKTGSGIALAKPPTP
ncbi:MAG: DUF4388 domain-containing protein [Candidatus Obscuribacterales bacterium]|nr:DUF4388 domain-containing protein [Candidatus Obscuribacterales bacterium]